MSGEQKRVPAFVEAWAAADEATQAKKLGLERVERAARSTVNRDAVWIDLVRELKRDPSEEEVNAECARRHELEVAERRQTKRAKAQTLAVTAFDALTVLRGDWLRDPPNALEALTKEEIDLADSAMSYVRRLNDLLSAKAGS